MRKRANGPYQHGNKYRAVLSPAPSDGTSRYRVYDTRSDCQAFVDAFNAETGDRTIGQAVSEYLAHLARYGFKRNRPLKPGSVTRARYHLVAFFQLTSADRNLKSVTPTVAAKFYAALVGRGVRTDTHRGSLAAAVQFLRWCEAQGWIKGNPLVNVRPEGERSQGKEVLKHDDARRFVDVALGERSEAGLVCATLLLMGLRVSELLDRTSDDLNLDPHLLNVPRGKTRAAKRLLSIPAPLGSLLAARVEGKARDERLFSLTRYAVHYHVRRLCRAAGVPVVCPHGLRGSAATNIVGASSLSGVANVGDLVESARRRLGHETADVTKGHYIAPGTIESVEAAVKAQLLGATSADSDGWN